MTSMPPAADWATPSTDERPPAAGQFPKTAVLRRDADLWWWAGIAVLAVGSGALYLWGIADGARSEYYAAIAKSMSMSWHNFLFGAVDPSGTVSVDKIPGSFWLMALSVKLFGVSTWAVLLPNGLASASTVVVLAHAVRRWLGTAAGFIAGALFALTPIVAAVARSNQPHVIFVLFLALAADRAVVALKSGSRRSLVAAGLWIAAAFQCYMLEAWALWPALIVTWLLAAPSPWRRRVTDLLVAGVVSFAASMSWILLVELTPAASRPWVGGSNGNSAFEMVFGYNGLGRFGQSVQGGGSGGVASTASTYRGFAAPFGGTAGWGRLFNDQVAGQIAWLMPATLLAIGIVLWSVLRLRSYFVDRAPAIFFTAWFAIYASMFSLSSGIHQFYTAALAPAVAALVAGAVVVSTRSAHWYGRVAVATMLLGTTTYATFVTRQADGYMRWAPLVQLMLALLAVTAVVYRPRRLMHVMPFVLAAALAFTPAVWAIDVRNHPNSINPIAGPEQRSGGAAGGPQGGFGQPPQGGGGLRTMRMGQGPGGGAGALSSYNAELVDWLTAHRAGARFLFATFGAMSAAPYITATGENVLPIGGFDGADPSPTLTQLKAWVASGELRYILTGGQGGGPGGGAAGSAEIQSWVRANCVSATGAPVGNLLRCGA